MKAPKRLPRSFYSGDSTVVAPLLLNKLIVTRDGRAGRIVEVEAYRGAVDPASHAYRGATKRNQVMFGPPGHLYVYFSYGVHWCANLVTGRDREAQAVLLRALEPVDGIPAMRAARWSSQARRSDRDLCRGPGRLCQALGIDKSFDGADLVGTSAAVWIADDGTPPPAVAVTAPRVGVSAGQAQLWRFCVPDPAYLSRPVPKPSDLVLKQEIPVPSGNI